MYPVSNDYLTEIAKNNPNTRITGTLTLKNGSVVQITNSVIAKAPTIMNQCVNNSELKLGQVYQAQLDISIYSNINRYSVYGAVMVLSFGLKIGNTWEEVPLGEYIVSECIRTSNDILQITLLDKMNKLDIKYSGDQVSGTPYDILSYIAASNGLVLAQSQSDIEALPNGTHVFGMPEKHRSSTWRDVLGDIAACLAGNAIIDRAGKIFIQTFTSSVTRTLSASVRTKESISDYLVVYSSASCVKAGSTMTVGTDGGQDLSLDDNDFLQLGTDDSVRRALTNIINAISTLEYTPSDFSWYGDPSLDLGDLIEATGGAASTSTLIPIQKFKWTWRGEHQIIAVGKNPNLGEAKSLNDKKIDNLLQNTTENEVTYFSYTNVRSLTINSETETTIASLRFTSAQKTTVKVMHEFLFDILTDLAALSSYEVRYYLDNELINYKPYERVGGIGGLSEGDDTEISICRDFFWIIKDVEPNIPHTWQVKILTHGIDSMTIEAGHARVVVEGQRMYSEEAFDGHIEVFENITIIPFGYLGLLSITDSSAVSFANANKTTASEIISEQIIASMQVISIYEGTGELAPHIFLQGGFHIITDDGKYITTDGGDRIITD